MFRHRCLRVHELPRFALKRFVHSRRLSKWTSTTRTEHQRPVCSVAVCTKTTLPKPNLSALSQDSSDRGKRSDDDRLAAERAKADAKAAAAPKPAAPSGAATVAMKWSDGGNPKPAKGGQAKKMKAEARKSETNPSRKGVIPKSFALQFMEVVAVASSVLKGSNRLWFLMRHRATPKSSGFLQASEFRISTCLTGFSHRPSSFASQNAGFCGKIALIACSPRESQQCFAPSNS